MRYFFITLFIATSLIASSQVISGRLIEENGKPLANVLKRRENKNK